MGTKPLHLEWVTMSAKEVGEHKMKASKAKHAKVARKKKMIAKIARKAQKDAAAEIAKKVEKDAAADDGETADHGLRYSSGKRRTVEDVGEGEGAKKARPS
jgi:hypothetical protein